MKTLFAIFLDRRLIDRQGRSGDSSLGLENGAISYETEFWGRPVFALKMMSNLKQSQDPRLDSVVRHRKLCLCLAQVLGQQKIKYFSRKTTSSNRKLDIIDGNK